MLKSIYDVNDDGVVDSVPAHKASHQDGGSDEISVQRLDGLCLYPQTPTAHAIAGAKHTSSFLYQLNALIFDATLDDRLAYRTPLSHNQRHRYGQSDEIDATRLVGRTNFVDRGDPSVFDFTLTNFTTDGNLHDIDFSSIIPAGAVAAYLLIQIADNIVGSVLYLIKKGNTYPYNRLMLRTQVANETVSLDGFVSIDANRKAQYFADNITYNRIDICVRGWLI